MEAVKLCICLPWKEQITLSHLRCQVQSCASQSKLHVSWMEMQSYMWLCKWFCVLIWFTPHGVSQKRSKVNRCAELGYVGPKSGSRRALVSLQFCWTAKWGLAGRQGCRGHGLDFAHQEWHQNELLSSLGCSWLSWKCCLEGSCLYSSGLLWQQSL